MAMFLLFLRGTAAHRIRGVQLRTNAAWTHSGRLDRLSRDRSPLGGHLRELGKRVLADGRVRPVDHTLDSERISGIETARWRQGTRRRQGGH